MISEIDVLIDTVSEEEVSERWMALWGVEEPPQRVIDRIWLCMDWLNPVEKELIICLYIDGETYTAISKKMEINVQTLHERAKATMKKLKLLMQFVEIMPRDIFIRRIMNYINVAERPYFLAFFDSFSYDETLKDIKYTAQRNGFITRIKTLSINFEERDRQLRNCYNFLLNNAIQLQKRRYEYDEPRPTRKASETVGKKVGKKVSSKKVSRKKVIKKD
jgi:hypothetical protein